MSIMPYEDSTFPTDFPDDRDDHDEDTHDTGSDSGPYDPSSTVDDGGFW